MKMSTLLFTLLFFFIAWHSSASCCIPVKIVIETGRYANEISWETDPPSEGFSDFGAYEDFSLYEHEYCLSPSTAFTFVAKDSNGDGWDGGKYSVFVNDTRVLGPTTFTNGYVFAEEQFTTCACSCTLDCASLHRSCCVSESECGQCLPGFYSDEYDVCKKSMYVESELIAWKTFFVSTGGWAWTECNSEIHYHDPCINCGRILCDMIDGVHSITELSLSDTNLNGTIPTQISDMKNLTTINLSTNKLVGSIPNSVGNLKYLRRLDLRNNKLSGTIPLDLFKLEHLQLFWVNINKLTGTIPHDISGMRSIIWFGIGFNDIQGVIPGNIFLHDQLMEIHLGRNRLTGTIPNEVSSTSKLRWVYLFQNELSGTIPSKLSQLMNLDTLDLYMNNLNGTIPPEISQLLYLVKLDLKHNNLVGTIPVELTQLSNLKLLDLSFNSLSGTLSGHLNLLKNLEFFSIGKNFLHGTIPLGLFDLFKLKNLALYHNKFEGTIPAAISSLQKLELLDLQINQLHGTIPTSIGNLKKLIWMELHMNQLTGEIPNEVSQMDSLQYLILDQNKLSGSIPRGLSNIRGLSTIIVSRNNLEGSIHDEIFQIKELRFLMLNGNRFFGTIPRSDYQSTHLMRLDLSYNNMNGTLPYQIFQLHNLQRLLLNSNDFDGTIHSNIHLLRNLEYLYLQNNRLSGNIPVEMVSLKRLKQLNIHMNEFNGAIPFEVSQMKELQLFDVSFNKLNGSLPSSLGNLNKAKDIDISHNRFTGTFPFEWNDIFQLMGLRISKANFISPYFLELQQFKACCNQFSGYLSGFIGPLLTLQNLIHFDLSHNQVEGSFNMWTERWFEFTIDSAILSGLNLLTILDLSFNKIQQELPQDLPESLFMFFITNNLLTGPIPDSYVQLFIFNSQENNLRSGRLPSFLNKNDLWTDLNDYNDLGVECQQFTTVDGLAKIFDIHPVYDHFNRCKCKAGYFNFQSSLSFSNSFAKCDPTPPGHYTPTRNRYSQAIPCPVGHFSNLRISTQCAVCTSDTFSVGGQFACFPCPTRAQCINGVISLKENTWIHPIRILNESIKEEHFHHCLNNEACVVNGSSVRCEWDLGYDNSSVLCSECLSGFYSSNRMTKSCKKCTIKSAIASVLINVIVLLLILSFIIRKLVKTQKNKMMQADDSTSSQSKKSDTQSDKKGLLRVLVGHIQVLMIVSHLQLKGPQEFHSSVEASVGSTMPSLSPAAIKCILNIDFHASMTVAALTPLILIVILLVLVTIVTLLLRSTFKIAIRSIFTDFVFLFYLVHPSVMKQLLETFHIHEQTIEGEQYLQSDMFIGVSSPEYSRMFVIAFVGVIAYGLVAPLIVCISLLRKAQVKDEIGRSALGDLVFETDFGFLYQGYRATGLLYLWEIIIYFRKSFLLLLGVFFGHDSFLQSYLASVVLIGAFILQSKFQPYRSDRMNRVESRSLGVLGVTQMCLMLSSHYGFAEEGNNWAVLISVILLVMNGWFIVNAIKLVLKSVSKTKEIKQVHPMNTKTKGRGNSWSQIIDCGDKLMRKLNKMDDEIKFNELDNMMRLFSKFTIELEKKLSANIENQSVGRVENEVKDEKDDSPIQDYVKITNKSKEKIAENGEKILESSNEQISMPKDISISSLLVKGQNSCVRLFELWHTLSVIDCQPKIDKNISKNKLSTSNTHAQNELPDKLAECSSTEKRHPIPIEELNDEKCDNLSLQKKR